MWQSWPQQLETSTSNHHKDIVQELYEDVHMYSIQGRLVTCSVLEDMSLKGTGLPSKKSAQSLSTCP